LAVGCPSQIPQRAVNESPDSLDSGRYRWARRPIDIAQTLANDHLCLQFVQRASGRQEKSRVIAPAAATFSFSDVARNGYRSATNLLPQAIFLKWWEPGCQLVDVYDEFHGLLPYFEFGKFHRFLWR
jgi:hypothetical protein